MIIGHLPQPVQVDSLRTDLEDGLTVADITAPRVLYALAEESNSEGYLASNGCEFLLAVMGAEHDYLASPHISYENEPDELPSWAAPERHQEFLKVLLETATIPEEEPVQFAVFAYRLRDFSLNIAVMEADGDFHDWVAAPLLGRTVGTTLSISDHIVGFMTLLGQHFWGKAWEPRRCHHNKVPPPGAASGLFHLPGSDD